MLTKLFPMVQFKPDTWEIDEFDVSSMYLLIGKENAMLIDTGMGIGDLKGAVEQITDKPLIVVLTHNHGDHSGNVCQFSDIWVNKNDMDRPMPFPIEKRREDIRMIALKHGRAYPYNIDTDVREPSGNEPIPQLHYLKDGQQFNLGERIITAYDCPGHSPGEMVFLDETTRSLFCGDALNYNMGIRDCSIQKACKYLERLDRLKDKYDDIYNGHHDFRPFGAPLGKDCLPNAINLCNQLMSGVYSPAIVKSFWGPASGRPDRTMVIRGRNYLEWNPDLIFEKEDNCNT
jgi:hydroxyacylglutathione hydrolase